MKFRTIQTITALALGAVSLFAKADGFDAVPTGWRLQEYVPNQVVLFYTPSPCVSGSLNLRSSAVDKDRDRLWSMILFAKATNRHVLMYYTNESGTCYIDSFALKEE